MSRALDVRPLLLREVPPEEERRGEASVPGWLPHPAGRRADLSPMPSVLGAGAAVKRGRWKPLFTPEELKAIRERFLADPKLTIRKLATEHGVSYYAMSQIVNGEWEDREGGRWIQ